MENFKAILTRKFGPAPVWVYGLVAIVALAWYLRKRAASKPAVDKSADKANESVLKDYALGYPMPYQGDVTVQVPATQPATGTPWSDPYQQPVYDPSQPYGRTGKLPAGSTLEGLSSLYWGDPKWANLLFLANIDAIQKNKGKIDGLDLVVPVNPQYK